MKLQSTKRDLIIITCVFTFLAGLLLFKLWFFHGFIPDWDEAHHLKMGVFFYHAFKVGDTEYLKYLLTDSHQLYPPLYHFLIAVNYFIVGITTSAAVYANIPFILILMLSLYGIGEATGNKRAGLMAALLTPILPAFLSIQERAIIDYASISLFILSFYLLIKSQGLIIKKYSVYLGIVILLELLVKWPFVIPSLPFVLYFLKNFYTLKSKRKVLINNLAILLLICIPGFLWYLFNFKFILVNLNFFWDPNSFPQIIWGFPNGFTLTNFLLYSFIYPSSSAGVGLLILPFLFFGLLSKKKNLLLNYLAISVIVTYAVLTYLDDKSSYYIAYAYPLLMLMTLSVFTEIKQGTKRVFFVAIFAGLILVNFFLTLYNFRNFNDLNVNLAGYKLSIVPNYLTKFPNDNWPTRKIVRNELTEAKCTNGVLIFPDSQYLSHPNIEYYLIIGGVNIKSAPAYRMYNPATSKTFNLGYIDLYDCVITKSGYPGIFSNKYVNSQVNEYLDSNKEFKKVIYDAPDKSEIYIYERLVPRLPSP